VDKLISEDFYNYNVAVKLVDENVARGFGEKTAIYHLEQQITYNQVQAEVNKLGNGLKSLGVAMEDRVLLLLLDCPEFIYSFFGTIKIGAVAIPTNTLLKPEDYLYLLNDCRAKVVIVSEELAHLIEAIRSRTKYLLNVIVVGRDQSGQIAYSDLTAGQSEVLNAAETCKDDPALWLYSSGTTGFPKGAVHLHHDMIYAADTYAKGILKLGPDDITYSVARLFFSYGLGNALYYPFRVGAATVLSPQRPEPELVLANVEKYKPTIFYSVPTSYRALLETAASNNADFSSVRICVSAGEALPANIFHRWKDRFGLEIIDGLGCTEILNIFISNRPGWAIPECTGQVVPGYEVKIVDENGKDLPKGEVGTLYVKEDSIAAYYWNKHEKSKATFLGEWLNTGDRFYQDDSGYFWFVGREDDLLKVGGIWVSPLEVERTLLKHEAVSECAVIGKADEDNLIKPKAFIVLKGQYDSNDELAHDLKQFIKDQIAYYKYPRWIQFVSDLPKTATGKIQRYKLRELEGGGL